MEVSHFLNFLFFIIFVIIISIIIYKSIEKGLEKSWGEFALKHNLKLQKGTIFSYPSVTGNYKGYKFMLYIFTRYIDGIYRHRKPKAIYTGMALNPTNYINCNMHIYKEGLLSKIGKAIGMQDIQSGDPEFDKNFVIKSSTPDPVVQRILTAPIRTAMLNLKDIIDITVSFRGVTFEKKGFFTDVNSLEALAELMYNLLNSVIEVTKEKAQVEDTVSPAVSSTASIETGKICPSCGYQVPPGNRFCINCGSKL